MRISAIANEALISIGTSRLRTFLAMLGIVIGVASVIVMLAIGAGSRQQMEDAIASLGSNLLTVFPGNIQYKGVFTSSSLLNMDDVEAIGNLPSVQAAAPSTFPRSFQAAAGKRNWNAQVVGTTTSYFDMSNWAFVAGRAFSSDETRVAAPVAVIGATIAAKLFPDETGRESDLIGRGIQINNMPFRIDGVLKAKGAGMNGTDQDDVILVPITTAQNRLWGHYAHIVSFILAQAVSADVMDQATNDIGTLLRQRHHLRESAADNFTVRNMASVMELAGNTTQTMSMLLGAVASISLVVGGIGIMNIMLVNVTERSREIGIRKALGATSRQILIQFLLEAVMITGAGSLTGL